MNNTFFKERMISCLQRIFCQYIASLVNDQSHESCSNTKIKEVHGHMIRYQACKYHLVEIQPVTNKQSYRHKGYCGVVAFRGRTHIYQQGSQKINDKIQVKNP